MEKSYNKLITVSFIITAFLFGYIVSVLMRILANSWGTFARLTGEPTIQHGLPVLFGVALFSYLVFSKNTKLWAGEVTLEISKVVWPSIKDTKALTIVVCFIILIASVIFWIFDMISSKLVEFILGLHF